jgi:hypothetical protein
MCDEDHPYALQQRLGVESLALPDEVWRRDERAQQVFGEAYPVAAAASAPEGRKAGHALVEVWPKRIRGYWGYGVLRTELAIVERGQAPRVLASMMLYRRVLREEAPFRALRESLAPPPESCQPSDRVEFVKRVLQPPA